MLELKCCISSIYFANSDRLVPSTRFNQKPHEMKICIKIFVHEIFILSFLYGDFHFVAFLIEVRIKMMF